ncbi:MAG: hypothetical protein IPN87_12595 [Saprospiraceae bacterium]|nr:hypothetical protein [Candidatus Brachybacter algidus]
MAHWAVPFPPTHPDKYISMSMILLFATNANQFGFCNVNPPPQMMRHRPKSPAAYLHSTHPYHKQKEQHYILARELCLSQGYMEFEKKAD